MDRNARHGWLVTALAGALIVSAIMGTAGVPASSGSAARVSRERVAEQTVRAAAEQRMGGSWLVFPRYVLRLIRARYLCRGLRCARPIRWCSGKC